MSSRQKVQSHEHKSVSIPVPTQTPGTDLQSLYGNSFLSHEMEATEDDGGTGLFSHPGAISLSSSPAPPSARPDGGDEPVIPEHLVEELWRWILDDGDTAPSHLQNQEMAERVPAPEAPLDWWESYAAEADRTLRRRWVFQACDDGSVRALIDALPKDILSLDTSPYEENLDEVLDFVQQHATRQASGKSLAELGEIQGAYMHTQARQQATEQNGMHATPEQMPQRLRVHFSERHAPHPRLSKTNSRVTRSSSSVPPFLLFRERNRILAA